MLNVGDMFQCGSSCLFILYGPHFTVQDSLSPSCTSAIYYTLGLPVSYILPSQRVGGEAQLRRSEEGKSEVWDRRRGKRERNYKEEKAEEDERREKENRRLKEDENAYRDRN